MSKRTGWHGESTRHAQAGSMGGKKTAALYGATYYKKIGEKGGKVSPTNFKFNPKKAQEVGRVGGKSHK